jgi:hypothetical protein
VLCADETPTNVISKNTDEHGKPVLGSPHAVTVRTPDARLVWYTPIGSRSKTALAGMGVLEGYTGYLVPRRLRRLAPVRHPLDGVQQCAAQSAHRASSCSMYAAPRRYPVVIAKTMISNTESHKVQRIVISPLLFPNQPPVGAIFALRAARESSIPTDPPPAGCPPAPSVLGWHPT